MARLDTRLVSRETLTVVIEGAAANRSRVSALSLDDLPRLPRAADEWTRRVAHARARFPAEAVASCKGLGSLAVRPSWLSFVSPTDEAGVSFTLDVRAERCRITLEPFLSLRLAAAVLGLPPPSAVRALGRGERGVVAAVIVAFLDGVGAGAGVRVSLEDAGPPDGADVLSIDLQVHASGFAGLARLEIPARLVPVFPDDTLVADPRALVSQVVLELARTTLPADQIVSAEAGDAVVFEGSSPAHADTAWPVEIRCGEAFSRGELRPDGTLHRTGPLARGEGGGSMSSESNDDQPAALSTDAARALGAAPVEVVAELGRLTLRGDELVGLVEGGVLTLGPRRPAEVQLRVGGRLWATGELVAVDDELGVRITALVRSPG